MYVYILHRKMKIRIFKNNLRKKPNYENKYVVHTLLSVIIDLWHTHKHIYTYRHI